MASRPQKKCNTAAKRSGLHDPRNAAESLQVVANSKAKATLRLRPHRDVWIGAPRAALFCREFVRHLKVRKLLVLSPLAGPRGRQHRPFPGAVRARVLHDGTWCAHVKKFGRDPQRSQFTRRKLYWYTKRAHSKEERQTGSRKAALGSCSKAGAGLQKGRFFLSLATHAMLPSRSPGRPRWQAGSVGRPPPGPIRRSHARPRCGALPRQTTRCCSQSPIQAWNDTAVGFGDPGGTQRIHPNPRQRSACARKQRLTPRCQQWRPAMRRHLTSQTWGGVCARERGAHIQNRQSVQRPLSIFDDYYLI